MESPVLSIKGLNAHYGEKHVLKDVNLDILRNRVTGIMGPSGCGKTTLIRCINRLHELSKSARVEGDILLDGKSIFKMSEVELRKKVGMVFQRPNPFPTMNIYDNVIAGYILNGIKLSKEEKDMIVETSLKKVYLWDEVKDSLKKKGTFLSGGQQQRLCIARALAMNPEILLLDEPTSALDPKATFRIEELIAELKKDVTIIMVTHNVTQAGRISDYIAFMYGGEVVEYGKTEEIFTTPKHDKTEEYLMGKFE